jgi:hypothetical protein
MTIHAYVLCICIHIYTYMRCTQFYKYTMQWIEVCDEHRSVTTADGKPAVEANISPAALNDPGFNPKQNCAPSVKSRFPYVYTHVCVYVCVYVCACHIVFHDPGANPMEKCALSVESKFLRMCVDMYVYMYVCVYVSYLDSRLQSQEDLCFECGE